MKRVLGICLALGALALSACATDGTLPPSAPGLAEQAEIATAVATAPADDRAEILVAVTAEVGARFRCPRNPLELQVLAAGRLAFDLFARPRIQPSSGAIVDQLRMRTDAACNIVVSEAEPPAEPPPVLPTV